MPPTATTDDRGLLALRPVLRTASADLRWVALAREAQLGRLTAWRGRHATLHRDRAGVVLARTWRLEHAVDELAALVDAAIAATRRRPLLREGPAAFAVGAATAATVAADPTTLRAVAGDGRPHGVALRASAVALEARSRDVADPGGQGGGVGVGAEVAAGARAAAAMLRGLARRWDELDSWVVAVADAIARQDRAGAVALTLLGLGTDPSVRALAAAPHPAPDRGAGRAAVPREHVDDTRLLATLRDPTLSTAARHLLAAVLLDRWADDLARAASTLRDRARTTDRGVLDRLAAVVDDVLLDPIDPAVHVRTDTAEEAAELERLARGLHELAVLDDVSLLDARPGTVGAPTVLAGPSGRAVAPTLGRRWRRGELAAPSVRLAIGDPAAATHVAVLLAGTASGVGRHAVALRYARALHRAIARRAPPHVRAAVVVELYDAPVDLARATDRTYAAAAARELATGLTTLGIAADTRTTLVGHSYGAVAAGLTAAAVATGRRGRPAVVDALVALGAPGLGVSSIDDLGLARDEVWAARTPTDPIALVDDLVELARATGARPSTATAAHGPDPASAGFGARRLPTSGPRGRTATGHLEYLDEGTSSLDATAAVVLGEL